MDPAIIVHGGAKEIAAEEQDAHREGCRKAAEAGWEVLSRGGSAMRALEAAIRVLEDDPTFNAGYGAELNSDGEVQMDAGVMSGGDLKAGAVGYIQGVKNPISVARCVWESGDVLLAGEGAYRFAVEQNLQILPNEDLVTEARRRDWEKRKAEQRPMSRANNTVGCVAIDSDGCIAAGASTGGTGFNRPGRMGDTPQLGCGFYANDRRGGCSMTGDGEEIARVVLAKWVVDRLDGIPGDLDRIAGTAIRELEQRVAGEGGCIILDQRGRIGWWHNSAHMAVGYRTGGFERALAFISKQEEGGARAGKEAS